MKIAKSLRHAKLTGDFAEHLVLYWLSKYGFECARVDHTGIDLIARTPKNGVRMGISVKSRSRIQGREKDNVRVEVEQLRKAAAASETFGCTPYMAIVVDGGNLIRCFVLPLKTFYALYRQMRHRFKAAAVKLSSLPGVLIKEVAEALEVHSFMLSPWRKQVPDRARHHSEHEPPRQGHRQCLHRVLLPLAEGRHHSRSSL